MLQIPSTIEKIESRADRTWKLVIGTQELSEQAGIELIKLNGKLGHFVFSEQDIKQEDIPTDPIVFKDDRTLDERLNAVLFKYHMDKTNDSKSFHIFKRTVYETLIERYKEKINEINEKDMPNL